MLTSRYDNERRRLHVVVVTLLAGTLSMRGVESSLAIDIAAASWDER